MRKIILSAFTLISSTVLIAQDDKGQLSGNFQSRSQFYDRDDAIAANTVQYKTQKSSNESFLYLNYKWNGFVAEMRYDLFANSPLLNTQAAYTNNGIGYWSLSKTIDKLHVTAGYFYDQFGTGLVFRAYEDRNIGIDYAIQGARVKYNFSNGIAVKAFTGVQKGFLNLSKIDEDLRFKSTPQVIAGVNAEKMHKVSDNFSVMVGASMVKRTLEQATMNSIVNEINSYDSASSRFIPKYNTYAINGYTSMNLFKRVTIYYEYVYKTAEALRNPFSAQLFSNEGAIHYANLSYSVKGFGLNLQGRKIQTYQFRSSPNYILLNGQVVYVPTITKLHAYRLLARYNPAAQELGESAVQADFTWTPKMVVNNIKNPLTVTGNYSYVVDANNKDLFREAYIDAQQKLTKSLKVLIGIQSVFYNQRVYEFNPNAPNVYTLTPFGEFSYKFTGKKRKQSLRLEWQYLNTDADLGSFANVLFEYNVAKWSFAVGDMINTNPVRTPGTPQETLANEKSNYYSVFVGYIEGPTRVALSYIKQVQGVNCTGGICRVEPAFSGVRLELSTSF